MPTTQELKKIIIKPQTSSNNIKILNKIPHSEMLQEETPSPKEKYI